jgi:hypothetical protein
MPLQTWTEALASSQADSVAVANTLTETSILPTNCNIIFPSSFFVNLGQSIYIRAFGRASTVVTTPGTLKLSVKLGGTGASGTAVATFTTPTLTTTAQTNDSWWLEWMLQLRVTGSVAQFMHLAQFTSGILNNNTVAPQTSFFPATAPAVGTAFDARASNQFDLTATWSVASASNTIQTHGFILQSLN